MADIPFEREMAFTYGRADRVSPLIRRVVANNPGPFTFTGTGTYIVGEGTVAVIDPGPDDEAHLAALTDALDGETVSHILVTHTHLDHSPLAAPLKALTGAEVLAYGPHGSGPRSGPAEKSGSVALDASGDTGFVPDRTLKDGEVVEGPGWTLEAVFTPGHMANHMAFALKEENALFSGDHVMAWSTSVIAPPDGNMADYMASLRRVLERDEEVYWPTHGPERRDPKPFVRAFLTHRQMRERAILKRIESGDRTIAEIVSAIYREVDPKLHPAAAMSVLAHMEHLIEQDLVETDGTPGLESEYRRKG